MTNNVIIGNYVDLSLGLFRWKGGICCDRIATMLQWCALPRGTCAICQVCRSLRDTPPSRKAPGAPPPTCRCGLLCYDLQPVRTGQTCQVAGKPGNIFSHDHAGNNRICVYLRSTSGQSWRRCTAFDTPRMRWRSLPRERRRSSGGCSRKAGLSEMLTVASEKETAVGLTTGLHTLITSS